MVPLSLRGCGTLLCLALQAVTCYGAVMPVGPPMPPPAYMVDNTNNAYHVAPDAGSRNGPVVPANYQANANGTPSGSRPKAQAAPQAAAADSFWMSNVPHGQMPLAPSGYKVYRNVRDYGAKGDGTTDDTKAINAAIVDGGRCGQTCGSSTVLGAVIYFPAGTYLVSSPLIQYYYSQFIGDPNNKPVIKGSKTFKGIALIDTDVYIPGGNGSEWYINQNNFYRQIRNFVLDMTGMNRTNTENDQPYVPTGIHWQVAQATSLQNIDFKMAVSDSAGSATAVGIFAENGSGGFVSDLTFTGGNIGMRAGSQQFTARNLKFTSCLTAISMVWDWGWLWKNIYILSCYVAIDNTNPTGPDGQGVGSIAVVDSTFDGVPYGITVQQQKQPAINLDNLVVSNSDNVVLVSGGSTILAGPGSGSTRITTWSSGRVYDNINGGGRNQVGALTAPKKSTSLLTSDGSYYVRSRPQYENLSTSSFKIVTDYGAVGDGKTDCTNAINSALSAAGSSYVLFFPAGIYVVTGTINVPVGARIVGHAWSQIMASGSYFADEANPKVVVKVGNPGDVGVLEISDILFTVRGPTAGAILVQWNVAASSPGSAGMWDTHFRVGGAKGSSLDISTCPKLSGKVNSACKAASMMFHITPKGAGYFENIWVWTSDHYLDDPSQTQIDVYTARGVLIESETGPVWMYGTASEHSVLYQYQLAGANNIFLGHMQTETPYYETTPVAPQPFQNSAAFPADPSFNNCGSTSNCAMAWALRIISSQNVFIYSAGIYSFFQKYDQSCLKTESCQQKLFETSFSQGIWMYTLYTKGALEAASPQGGVAALQQDNRNGFLTAIAAWLPLALTGANIGGSQNGTYSSPISATIVPLPCTTVAKGSTLTLSSACSSGVGALPTAGRQNSPQGPTNCKDNCDIFRRLTSTCCGTSGSLGSPIFFPPVVPIPLPVPLPAGFVPPFPLDLPAPGAAPGSSPTTKHYDAGTPLPVPVIIPPGFKPPSPGLTIPVAFPLPADPPGANSDSSGDRCSGGKCCNPNLDLSTGRCSNGNFPLFDPLAFNIDCTYADEAAADLLTSCQDRADMSMNRDASGLQAVKSCACLPGTARRELMQPRAPVCPPPGTSTSSASDPRKTGVGCEHTFVCDYALFPQVCANAQSAIDLRGKPATMTFLGSRGRHVKPTGPWYRAKNQVELAARHRNQVALSARGAGPAPKAGWGLNGCNVDEYPLAAGRETADDNPVLRLVDDQQNRDHGTAFNQFIQVWQDFLGEKPADFSTKGHVFCYAFTRAPASLSARDYLLGANDPNHRCAVYGAGFQLVNDRSQTKVDPWFARNNRPELSFCGNPSPGFRVWNSAQNRWVLTNTDTPAKTFGVTFSSGAVASSCYPYPTPTAILQKRQLETPAAEQPSSTLASNAKPGSLGWSPVATRAATTTPIGETADVVSDSLPRAEAIVPLKFVPQPKVHVNDTKEHGQHASRNSSLATYSLRDLEPRASLHQRAVGLGSSYLDVNVYRWLSGTCSSGIDEGTDPCQYTSCGNDNSVPTSGGGDGGGGGGGGSGPCENDCTGIIPQLSIYGDKICTQSDKDKFIDYGTTKDANGEADWFRVSSKSNCYLVVAKSAAHRGFPDQFCFLKSELIDFINKNALGCNAGDDFNRQSPAVGPYSQNSGLGQACLTNFKHYQECGIQGV